MEKQKEIERLKALTYKDIYYEMQTLKNTITEINQALQLQQAGVIGSYSEKDMDKAYDKGFKDAMLKYRTDL